VSSIKLPLTLSMAGHAACLALLIPLLGKAPPLPQPPARGGIEVVLQPALPKPETASLLEPPPQPEAPPPPAETPPPVLDAPAAAAEAVPPLEETPAVVAEPPPPPPPKPAVKPPPKPVPRRLETAQPSPAPAPPAQAPPAVIAPPQTASAATPVPAPVPSPEVSAGYRALLSSWLESHKRYPDTARQRGEEGRAVLRFEVERSGRVIDYAVAKSTGYPDLDAAIEEMMRGAILPPFPAGMTQPRIEVSVTIRFSLAR
jgi:periplasmic protein TonB